MNPMLLDLFTALLLRANRAGVLIMGAECGLGRPGSLMDDDIQARSEHAVIIWSSPGQPHNQRIDLRYTAGDEYVRVEDTVRSHGSKGLKSSAQLDNPPLQEWLSVLFTS